MRNIFFSGHVFSCKNPLRKSPGLPRAFCSWAREHFVPGPRSIWESCARNELSSNFKGSVVAGGSHRGTRLLPPPHGESRPLLKCSWNRFLPTRGGDRSPESGGYPPRGCCQSIPIRNVCVTRLSAVKTEVSLCLFFYFEFSSLNLHLNDFCILLYNNNQFF